MKHASGAILVLLASSAMAQLPVPTFWSWKRPDLNPPVSTSPHIRQLVRINVSFQTPEEAAELTFARAQTYGGDPLAISVESLSSPEHKSGEDPLQPSLVMHPDDEMTSPATLDCSQCVRAEEDECLESYSDEFGGRYGWRSRTPWHDAGVAATAEWFDRFVARFRELQYPDPPKGFNPRNLSQPVPSGLEPVVPNPLRFHFDSEAGTTIFFRAFNNCAVVQAYYAMMGDPRWNSGELLGFPPGTTMGSLVPAYDPDDPDPTYYPDPNVLAGNNEEWRSWFGMIDARTFDAAMNEAVYGRIRQIWGSKCTNYWTTCRIDGLPDPELGFRSRWHQDPTSWIQTFHGSGDMQSPVLYPRVAPGDDPLRRSIIHTRHNLDSCIFSETAEGMEIVPWISCIGNTHYDSEDINTWEMTKGLLRDQLALCRARGIREFCIFVDDGRFDVAMENLSWQVWGPDLKRVDLNRGASDQNTRPERLAAVSHDLRDPLVIRGVSKREDDRRNLARCTARFEFTSGDMPLCAGDMAGLRVYLSAQSEGHDIDVEVDIRQGGEWETIVPLTPVRSRVDDVSSEIYEDFSGRPRTPSPLEIRAFTEERKMRTVLMASHFKTPNYVSTEPVEVRLSFSIPIGAPYNENDPPVVHLDWIGLALIDQTDEAFTGCRGDIDGDGDVTLSDYVVQAGSFGASVCQWTAGDLDGDGVVGLGDFTVLVNNFGCD
ncbi:MAG: dockerin type I repeat-containing protein [Planctomycetota bacterium]